MSFLLKFLFVVILTESAFGISTKDPATEPTSDVTQPPKDTDCNTEHLTSCKAKEKDNDTNTELYCQAKLSYVECVDDFANICGKKNFVDFEIIIRPGGENNSDCQKASQIVSKYDFCKNKGTNMKDCKAKEDNNATAPEKYCQAKLAYVECVDELAKKCGRDDIVDFEISMRPSAKNNSDCQTAIGIVNKYDFCKNKGRNMNDCKANENDNATDAELYCKAKLAYVECVDELAHKCGRGDIVDFKISIRPEDKSNSDCQKAIEIATKYEFCKNKASNMKDCKANENDNATEADQYCKAKLAYVECVDELAEKCGRDDIVDFEISIPANFTKNENCMKAEKITSKYLATTMESNVTSTILPTGNLSDSTGNDGSAAKYNTGFMVAFALLALLKALELAEIS